jgi:hypothetical protein
VVSRRFVAATAKSLSEWLGGTVANLSLAVLMLDGIVCGEPPVLVALGIDEQGSKHVLGLWEGATENATACTGLLSDLVKRGLDTTRSMLVVIDGSKALAKAVRDVFGKHALIQRCQVHKKRNVLEHLSERLRASTDAILSTAYRSLCAYFRACKNTPIVGEIRRAAARSRRYFYTPLVKPAIADIGSNPRVAAPPDLPAPRLGSGSRSAPCPQRLVCYHADAPRLSSQRQRRRSALANLGHSPTSADNDKETHGLGH